MWRSAQEKVRRAVEELGRLWLTGALCLLAALGYVFYGLLWIVRYMQTRKTLLAVVVVAVLFGAVGLVLWCGFGFGAGETVELIVEPGEPLGMIAERLENEEVVCDARMLALWMKLRGTDRLVQAGIHTFDRHGGIFAASRGLQEAKPIEVSVTIPEGMIIEQVAQTVARALEVDSAAFAAACYDSSFAAELGISAPSLEGYLFPETYSFPPGVSAQDVIRRMVNKFLEQYARLQPVADSMRDMTRHEIVTLASIVEKEAALASERGHISGVFHNRLRIGYPLGADPTVRYALRKFSGPLRVSELKSNNPYNTRVHAGLPPGPICSPGFGSLQAAVKPLETRDLYFVAKWDGTGAHTFSKTLAEHERKKHSIRRQNRQRIAEQRLGEEPAH